MNKITEKKEEKLPQKAYKAADAKDFILFSTKSSTDPDENLAAFARDYMPMVYKQDVPKEQREKMFAKMGELSTSLSLDTGFLLMESVGAEYRGLAVQMRNELQKEYGCDKPSEKALIDMVVNSYIRKLSYSYKMGANQKYLGGNENGYRAYLSKEIDRSHRQFLSALDALRLLRQPPLKVNVKAQNAFVAENQQLNNYPKKSNEAK